MPLPNPAEDIFLVGVEVASSSEEPSTPEEIKTDFTGEEAFDDDKETHVPITPSGPAGIAPDESGAESSMWSNEGDEPVAPGLSTPDEL